MGHEWRMTRSTDFLGIPGLWAHGHSICDRCLLVKGDILYMPFIGKPTPISKEEPDCDQMIIDSVMKT